MEIIEMTRWIWHLYDGYGREVFMYIELPNACALDNAPDNI